MMNENHELIGLCLVDYAYIGYRLTSRQRELISKYGAWMDALANGSIPPTNEIEKRFIEVVKGNIEAETEIEKTWKDIVKARSDQRKTRPKKEPRIPDFKPISVKVCPQCGMVDSNCTCRRGWY